MSWYTKISQQTLDVTIENDCYDSHGGEVFCALIARTDEGEGVGAIEYSVYDGVYHIKNMVTKPEYRRQGVATQMMNKLHELAQNDGATVDSGYSTDEGTKFMGQYVEPFKRQANHLEGWYRRIKTAEVSLYHGTVIDHLPSIQEVGLVPMLGQFVQDAYGSEYEAAGISLEDEFTELIYAADKLTLDKAITAMKTHIANKLGKSFHDITANDIRNHGLIVKVKGEPGNAEPPSPFEKRPEDYDQDWEMDASDRGLHGVEPGDYYSESPTGGLENGHIETIYGPSLLRLIKRYT